MGQHTVCVKVTREFLDDSVFQGNDLVTPHPEWGFPGLEPGDKWCLCAARYQEALRRGVAPPVDLEATHSSAIEFVTLEELKAARVERMKKTPTCAVIPSRADGEDLTSAKSRFREAFSVDHRIARSLSGAHEQILRSPQSARLGMFPGERTLPSNLKYRFF